MGKKKTDTENSEVDSGLEEADGFLPGTAPIVVKEIAELVEEIETTFKPKFAKARDALTAKQDRLGELAHKNIEHFSEPDEKGTRVYKVPLSDGTIGVVKITFEKEKILTATEKPKNPTV